MANTKTAVLATLLLLLLVAAGEAHKVPSPAPKPEMGAGRCQHQCVDQQHACVAKNCLGVMDTKDHFACHDECEGDYELCVLDCN